MAIEIRLFEDQMFEDLRTFTARTYKPGYFLSDRRYFDWWFRDSPANWDSQHRCLVALDGGEIVGFLGQVANNFLVCGKPRRGVWYTNGMIAPEGRGKGIGKQIYGEAQEYTEFAGAISWTPVADRVLTHIGFRTLHRNMRRAVAVLDPAQLDQFPTTDLERRSEIGTHRIEGQIETANAESWTEIPANVGTLWEIVAERYGTTTDRTRDFLTWRFLRHPRGKYEFVVLWEDGEPSGVATVRVESQEPTRVARIVDLWGTEEAIPGTLAKVVAFARQNNCILVDFCCAGSPDAAAFSRCGFVWLADQDAAVIPFLFAPIELAEFNEGCGFWARDRGILEEAVHSPSYFVRADSDRDRPQ